MTQFLFLLSFIFLISACTPDAHPSTTTTTTPPPTTTTTTLPPPPPDEKQWSQIISHDGDALCALDTKGALFCWGNNQQSSGIVRNTDETLDALGTGDTSKTLATPTKIMHPKPWKKVVMGAHGIICGIDEDNRFYCWGANRIFTMGSYGGPFFYEEPVGTSKIIVTKPHQITTDTFKDIAIKEHTICGIKSANGSLWCFGEKASSPKPQKIADGPFEKSILVGPLSDYRALDTQLHLWEGPTKVSTEKWKKFMVIGIA